MIDNLLSGDSLFFYILFYLFLHLLGFLVLRTIHVLPSIKCISEQLEQRKAQLYLLQCCLLSFAVFFIYFYLWQSIWRLAIVLTLGLVTLPHTLSFFSLRIWKYDRCNGWKLVWHLLLGLSHMYIFMTIMSLNSIHANGVGDFDVQSAFKIVAMVASVSFYILQVYYLAYLSHKSSASC